MISLLPILYLYRVCCTVVRGDYKLSSHFHLHWTYFSKTTHTLTSLCILLLGSRTEVRGAMCSLLEVYHIDIWCHTATLFILELSKFFQPLFTNVLWELEGWEMSNLWWNICFLLYLIIVTLNASLFFYLILLCSPNFHTPNFPTGKHYILDSLF